MFLRATKPNCDIMQREERNEKASFFEQRYPASVEALRALLILKRC